jgi:hypothetical protein
MGGKIALLCMALTFGLGFGHLAAAQQLAQSSAPSCTPVSVAQTTDQAAALVDSVCGFNARIVTDELSRATRPALKIRVKKTHQDGPFVTLSRNGLTVHYYDLPKGRLTASGIVDDISSAPTLVCLVSRSRVENQHTLLAVVISDLPVTEQRSFKGLGHDFSQMDLVSGHGDGQNEAVLLYENNRLKSFVFYCYTG